MVTGMPQVQIGTRVIGAGHPCFVVAEAGVNHNGDAELAARLVEAAAQAGADAVKFQTFKAERLATRHTPKADYQLSGTDPVESQFEMLRRLELPRACYPDLIKLCREHQIMFMSTPFDDESADFLRSLSMPAFKVPSGEITNLPFLEHLARTGMPLIVSTGMCSLDEVREAVEAINRVGNSAIVLLHCVSNYPAEAADVNLRAMTTLAETFQVPVGYSDHVSGPEVALAAVALGASVIEKHFTLDRTLPGPDHRASAEPHELTALVCSIRKVESSLGDGRKVPAASETNTAAVARRSLVAACDIPAGTVLTEQLVAIRRPGTGMSPSMRPNVVGRRTKRDIAEGTLLTPEMLS